MVFLITLALILILTVLVEIMTFVHELGHFMIAKFSKATVVEFAIGFGPALYQKKWGDTTYSLRALPFGGYVSILSDDIIDDLEKLKKMDLTPQQAVTLTKQLKIFDKEVDWAEKPTMDKVGAPKKVWFALMGITMNFFMLWAVLFVTYASAGKNEDSSTMYILPRAFALKEINTSIPASNEYEVVSSYLPFHHTKDISKKNADEPEYLPLYSQTQEINSSFSSGDDYYYAILNKIKDTNENASSWNSWKFNDNSSQDISYINLDENLKLTYKETEDVEFKETEDVEFNSDFQWGSGTEITFDYLIKYKEPSSEPLSYSYWLYSTNSLLPTQNPLEGDTSTNPEPPIYKFSSYIKGFIGIPIASSNGNEIVPSPFFGVIDDYMPMNFGESIYLSLLDSFKYLGEGFVVLFDVMTFGLVIDHTDYHMYANSQSVYTANFSLWWGNITFVMLVWMSYLMIVFNVLPFPPLDGWHAFGYAYEGIKKKKVSEKTTALVFKIGIALFFIALFGGIFIPMIF